MQFTPPSFTFIAAFLAAGAVQAGDLNIEISLPAARQGTVMGAVFDKAEGFPRGKSLYSASAQAVEGKAALRFTGLPNGDYAASVFLDENANLKLDINVFGLPTELYGFSRNARNTGGPVPFADAVFRIEDGVHQQVIELK